jgi:hypothetical protein
MMVLSAATADYSTGTVQMTTPLMPLHTVSLLTPASADLPRRPEAPGRLLRDDVDVIDVDVLSVPLVAAPSSVRPVGNYRMGRGLRTTRV